MTPTQRPDRQDHGQDRQHDFPIGFWACSRFHDASRGTPLPPSEADTRGNKKWNWPESAVWLRCRPSPEDLVLGILRLWS